MKRRAMFLSWPKKSVKASDLYARALADKTPVPAALVAAVNVGDRAGFEEANAKFVTELQSATPEEQVARAQVLITQVMVNLERLHGDDGMRGWLHGRLERALIRLQGALIGMGVEVDTQLFDFDGEGEPR